MNCERFRHSWTDWHEGWLGEGGAEMARHIESCEACARYDRQMRRLLGALSTLPLPDSTPVSEPVFAAATARRFGAPRWRWRRRSRSAWRSAC